MYEYFAVVYHVYFISASYVDHDDRRNHGNHQISRILRDVSAF